MTASRSEARADAPAPVAREVGNERVELITLYGIRGVAASLVALYHLQWAAIALFPGVAVVVPLLRIVELTPDMFFALSGFILAYNYTDTLRQLSGARYWHFLGLRIARLYPVHLFTLAVLACVVVLSAARGAPMNAEAFGFSDLLLNVLLINAWTWEYRLTWNFPGWTNSAEWFMYLLFPLLTWGIFARMRSGGMALLVATGVILVEMAAILLFGWDTVPLVRVSGAFVMGALVAQAHLLRWREAARWNELALAIFVLVAAVALLLPGRAHFAALPLLGLLILALARLSGSWLASPAAVFWGEISYSLYMTHLIVILVMSKLFPPEVLAGAPVAVRLLTIGLYVLAIVGVAIGTCFVIERPARRRLRRAFAGRARASGPRAVELPPAIARG